MTTEKKKIRVPDIAESVFEICYLLFALIAGIVFLVSGGEKSLFVLYGIMTLTLCGGDAFHLVPRVIRAFKGSSPKVQTMLGVGLQVSSITMTIFYVILLYVWKATFENLSSPVVIDVLVWVSAIARIVICLFPQNNWYDGKGNMKLSMIRNGVFLITGISIMALYIISGNTNGYGLEHMVDAIALSFVCYIPVTLLSKKIPAIGMLMIPKTCAYIWIICMGLKLLSL